MYPENRRTPLLIRLRDKIQYLSDNCSLQWLGYVFTTYPTPLFKRIFWLVTITACCVGSALVLRGALALYTSDAISYSVETDYLEWDTPFPALTICEDLNEGRIKKYLVQHNMPSSLAQFSEDVSFWNVKFCKSCTSCEIGVTCLKDFDELVNGIRMKCTELLTECWWNDQPFPCCDRFRPIATEYGTCFVFNSRWTDNETILNVNSKAGLPSLVFSATQNINVNTTDEDYSVKETFRRILNGLHSSTRSDLAWRSILMLSVWEEAFALPCDMYGLVMLMIRIHSPDDMITIASENILGPCSTLHRISDFDVTLKAEQTISDVSVQLLSQYSRDCLFKHERPASAHLWPFSRYSFSACIMYYRAVTQAEVCNCTHHFMPQLGDIPKCGIQGLACLHKTKKDKLNTEQHHCPMACEEVSYKDIHVACPRKVTNISEELSRRGTRGRMRLGCLPSLRVRRHAIRELLGLVVDVGGVIGVFFGASILSFLEIIYILFIRRYD